MFFLIIRAHQQVSGLIFQSMNYLMLKLLDSGRQSGITDGIGKMSILGEGKFMKAFLSDQCKEIEQNSRMGSTDEIGIERRLHTQQFTIIIHLIF